MTTVATSAAPQAEHRQYEPTPFAPRHARAFVDDLLDRWEWPGARAIAALLTSELVTDALRQVPAAIGLQIELTGETVRVEVSDEPGLIADASAGHLERQVARQLLENLARDWGSDLDRRRTTTWFSIGTDGPVYDPSSLGDIDLKLA